VDFIQSKLRNRLRWDKTEALMNVRINLNITHRAVDYTNITNVDFDLGEADEDEELELPSAWLDEEAEEEAPAALLPAAVARSASRASALKANKAAAAKSAPLPALPERGEGRRAARRSADDFACAPADVDDANRDALAHQACIQRRHGGHHAQLVAACDSQLHHITEAHQPGSSQLRVVVAQLVC